MIRVWTLGNLAQKITPTREAAAILSQMLRDKDIIWGPDLSVTIIPETQEELEALAKLGTTQCLMSS